MRLDPACERMKTPKLKEQVEEYREIVLNTKEGFGSADEFYKWLRQALLTAEKRATTELTQAVMNEVHKVEKYGSVTTHQLAGILSTLTDGLKYHEYRKGLLAEGEKRVIKNLKGTVYFFTASPLSDK